MKITYFVNTMFLIEGKHSRILTDPWVTSDNVSRSGLYNFPKLKFKKRDLSKVKPDFIYISHTHADHFDPDTLNCFDKGTPILISWYKENFTEKAIKRLGFKDIRVSPKNKPIILNKNDKCWIEPSAIYSTVDSLAVFEVDGYKIFNPNDCGFEKKQAQAIKMKFKKFDAALIPSGMQGPYPAFYENLSNKEKLFQSNKKKEQNFSTVKDYLSVIKPDTFFPLTGGAIYGGKKALLMKYTGVGTAVELTKYLKKNKFETNTVLLSENCSYDFMKKKIDGKFVDHSHENSGKYLKEISLVKSPFDKGGLFWIDESERTDLSLLLLNARLKQKKWQNRFKVKKKDVFFIDTGQKFLYRLCLGDETVTKVEEKNIEDKAYEIFRIPYSLLVGFLTRHYNYSNMKTQFVTFFRKPDIFNPDLHLLMSHLHL